MNNKIEQLAEKAGFMDAWYSESGDNCKTELEKFAKLIIKDTVRVIEKEISLSDIDNDYSAGIIQGLEDAIYLIERHFTILYKVQEDV